MARHRKKKADHVEPDLPIVPMLDMSFQLLFFFVMIFDPAPAEGQLAMSLPPAEQGGGAGIPDPTAEKGKKYEVIVESTENGGIAKMTLKEEGGTAAGDDLGADLNKYMETLKKLATAEQKRIEEGKKKGQDIPPPKLTLRIDGKLLQASVINLYDNGIRAGFADIAATPIGE